jgi:hypothetical protein
MANLQCCQRDEAKRTSDMDLKDNDDLEHRAFPVANRRRAVLLSLACIGPWHFSWSGVRASSSRPLPSPPHQSPTLGPSACCTILRRYFQTFPVCFHSSSRRTLKTSWSRFQEAITKRSLLSSLWIDFQCQTHYPIDPLIRAAWPMVRIAMMTMKRSMRL